MLSKAKPSSRQSEWHDFKNEIPSPDWHCVANFRGGRGADTSDATAIPHAFPPPPVDYPGAVWKPAAEGNFAPQERPQSTNIDTVVIHDIEGTAEAAINIFQRPGASVSAHYIVGSNGEVTQMVREHNVAWHAGNRDINHRSIGIETQGYAYRPGWFDQSIYETEAKLVRDITQRYNIPRDRAHIIAHAEVPNPRDPTKFGGASGHTDPGPYFDWASFMTLVRNDSRLVEISIPATIRPGETLAASVTLENIGDDLWPTNIARDPKTGLQSNGPIVVLATASGQPSPLFNSQGWIGPSVASGASTDTPPAAKARFDFTLQGPRELGEWSDQLRLTTMPTFAQGSKPVAFGHKVTIITRVVPWVIDAVLQTPTANASEIAPIARWEAALPLSGIYAVYVSPPRPSKTRRQKPFSYQISGTGQPFQLSAKEGGKGAIFAGYFQFVDGGKVKPSASVTLQSAPQGVDTLNAGMMRFIGPFPTASATEPDLSRDSRPNISGR